MVNIESLYRTAEDAGIGILYTPMENFSVVALRRPGIGTTIFLDPAKIHSDAEERTLLAFTLGRCMTDGFWIRSDPTDIRKEETAQAVVWAVEKLIPKDELKMAMSAGCHTRHDIAEYFGVTDAFVATAIEYCRDFEECVRLGHIPERLDGDYA